MNNINIPDDETDQPPGTVVPSGTVYFFNMSEDVWPFIQALDDNQIRSDEIAENAALADREYVSLRAQLTGPFTYVSPTALDPAFVTYINQLMGEGPAQILVTANHSGKLCADVARNGVVGQLNMMDRPLDILSYCASNELYECVNALGGVPTNLPEAPSPFVLADAMFPSTKSGIRQLISLHPEWQLPITEGKIVHGITEIIPEALKQIAKGGVVIKTDKGHCGLGIMIVRPGELGNDQSTWSNQLYDKLTEHNGYWDKFTAVVEQFIPTNPAIGGGFPNIEARVTTNGSVEILFYCGMRMLPNGVFDGVEIHPQVLPQEVMEKLRQYALTLGTYYSQSGYRGYFDIDCLAGNDGTIYVSESNMRRTGGTFAYQIAQRLFGNDFNGFPYIVTSMNGLKSGSIRFESLYERLWPILLKPGVKEGIIIISSNMLRLGKLAYMVVGDNKDRAFELESQMFSLLS